MLEAGEVADIVLLEANPLEDITNTQRIAAVVLRGRYLNREALDALLEEAEKAAAPARAAVETAIRDYLDAFAAQDPELVRGLVTEGFVVIENGYRSPSTERRFRPDWLFSNAIRLETSSGRSMRGFRPRGCATSP